MVRTISRINIQILFKIVLQQNWRKFRNQIVHEQARISIQTADAMDRDFYQGRRSLKRLLQTFGECAHLLEKSNGRGHDKG